MKKLFTIAILFSVPAYCQGQFQRETSGSVAHTGEQIMQLAHAIPADKYVSSRQPIAQICAHIISTNYFFASKLGAKIPDGVKMESIETDLKSKDAIAVELKRSFESITNAIKNTKDETLSAKLALLSSDSFHQCLEFPFPAEYTGLTAILISQGHASEHLKQLISYAQTNNITIPWSESK